MKVKINQDYYIALSDTLMYFCERNSLIYLKDFSDLETFVEEKGGHLTIYKECNDFLYELNNNEINEGLTYITQLFCITYIKSFCYIIYQFA